MTVTVYTKPRCSQCEATKSALTNKGIEYVPVDISEDKEAFELLIASGVQAAPYVTVEFADGTVDSWAGFKPDKIIALAAA